jgi:2-polyprenyl-3-methyl-5-hydroxy-6-metoxy-1,4-benzoquinol methylase
MCSKRLQAIEQMDDLEVQGPVVDQTLEELDIINRWLGGSRLTISGINALIRSAAAPPREYHIIDLGCGSGTMLKLVADWGRKQRIKLKLTGIDANNYIINYARDHSKNYPEIEYQVLNIHDGSFSVLQFDIAICTLFTHHLDDHELTVALTNWVRQARVGIVINDLHRHWMAYYSIKLLTRICSNSSMVRNDAPISVLRGFRRSELLHIMERCNLQNFRLSWHWAFRWLLVIQQPHGSK